jgi:hypothetical protein
MVLLVGFCYLRLSRIQRPGWFWSLIGIRDINVRYKWAFVDGNVGAGRWHEGQRNDLIKLLDTLVVRQLEEPMCSCCLPSGSSFSF